DFTINALAFSPSKGQLVDLFDGQKDIKDRLIRAVGIAEERFKEDALRILRTIRLSASLDFSVEEKTKEALVDNSHLLIRISKERIRDEFVKIVMSSNPQKG